MNQLVRFIENEVALDGPIGSSLNRLWYFVHCHQNALNVDPAIHFNVPQAHPPSGGSSSSLLSLDFYGLDPAYCQFLFQMLVRESDVRFGEYQPKSEENQAAAKPKKTGTTSSKRKGATILNKNVPEALHSNFNVIPLESSSLADRDVTAIYETYHDQFRIFMSEEARLDVLVPPLARPIAPGSWIVLQIISQTRASGITQSELTKQGDMDPRTVFHFAKMLTLKKLLIKLPFISKGCFSPLLLNARFALANKDYMKMVKQATLTQAPTAPPLTGSQGPESDRDGTVDEAETLPEADEEKDTARGSDARQFNLLYYLRRSISNVLATAPQHTLSTARLLQHLEIDPQRDRARYVTMRKTLSYLCDKQYLKRHTDAERTTTYTLLRAFQRDGLVGSLPAAPPHAEPSAPYAGSVGAPAFACEPAATVTVAALGSLRVDHPLEVQVYQHVAATPGGLTSLELQQLLNRCSIKPLTKLLDRFMAGPSKNAAACVTLKRAMELRGKLRRFRYFSESSVATVHRNDTHLLACIRHESQRVAQAPAAPATPGSASHTPPATAAPVTPAPSPGHKPPPPSSLPQEPPAAPPVRHATVDAARRREVILDLVRTHRVLELKLSTLRRIDTEMQRRFPPRTDAGRLDRRTLLRAVRHLEGEGLVQTQWFVLPLMSGRHERRQVMVAVDRDRPVARSEVLDVLANEENVICTAEPFEVFEPSAAEHGEEPADLLDGEKGDLDPASDPEIPSKIVSLPSIQWKSVASTYGWIYGRMLRLKLLHFFLYDLTLERGPEHAFEVAEVFRKLPLMFYLQIIGIAPRTDHFLDALAEQLMLPVVDLKDPIRTRLLPTDRERRRFRYQIFSLLKGLMALGLLTLPQVPELYKCVDETSSLERRYHVARCAFTMNYQSPQTERVALHTHALATFADVDRFWSGLESLAIQLKSKANYLPTDPLRFFMANRHWRRAPLPQRAALDAHCDTHTGYTPAHCLPSCRWIAHETGLTLLRTRLFFLNFEFHFQRIPHAARTLEAKTMGTFLSTVFGSSIPARRRRKRRASHVNAAKQAPKRARRATRRGTRDTESSGSDPEVEAMPDDDGEEEAEQEEEDDEWGGQDNKFALEAWEPSLPDLPSEVGHPPRPTYAPFPNDTPLSTAHFPSEERVPPAPTAPCVTVLKEPLTRTKHSWSAAVDVECLHVYIITAHFKRKEKQCLGNRLLPPIEVDGKPLGLIERRARYLRGRLEHVGLYTRGVALWDQHQQQCACSPYVDLDLCLQHLKQLFEGIELPTAKDVFFTQLPDSLEQLFQRYAVVKEPRPVLGAIHSAHAASSVKEELLNHHSFYYEPSTTPSLPFSTCPASVPPAPPTNTITLSTPSDLPTLLPPPAPPSLPLSTCPPSACPAPPTNSITPPTPSDLPTLLPLSAPPSFPHVHEEEDRLLSCMQLIKMICLVPEQVYPSHQAFRLLQQFPSAVIEAALLGLRNAGLLVRNRKDQHRQFQIAERHAGLLFANTAHRRITLALKHAAAFPRAHGTWHFHDWVDPHEAFLFLEHMVAGHVHAELRTHFGHLFGLSIAGTPLRLFMAAPLVYRLQPPDRAADIARAAPGPDAGAPKLLRAGYMTPVRIDPNNPTHVYRYCLKTPDGSGVFVPRLWCGMQGSTVPAILKACLISVWSVIFKAPGIPMTRIHSDYENLFFPCEILELLEMLLEHKAISFETIENVPFYYAEPGNLTLL